MTAAWIGVIMETAATEQIVSDDVVVSSLVEVQPDIIKCIVENKRVVRAVIKSNAAEAAVGADDVAVNFVAAVAASNQDTCLQALVINAVLSDGIVAPVLFRRVVTVNAVSGMVMDATALHQIVA